MTSISAFAYLPPPTVGSATSRGQSAVSTAALQEQFVAAYAAEPDVQEQIRLFEAALAASDSPRELLENRDARLFVLTIYGLQGAVDNETQVIDGLTTNPYSDESTVSALAANDARWRRANLGLDFFQGGLSRLRDPDHLELLKERFVEASWRGEVDATSAGLGTALAFQQRLPTYDSFERILDDPLAVEVVRRGANIPATFIVSDRAEQLKLLPQYLQLDDLRNASYVERLLGQYLKTTADLGLRSGIVA